MTTTLPYEYAVALRDAGYPQPYIAPGTLWYSIETAQVYDAAAHRNYRRPAKSGLAYAPGFDELVKATKTHVPAFLTLEELAELWLAQNKQR